MTPGTASSSTAPPVAVPRRGWGTCLAFVAGYVDTLGFIALFGLFTAHVTGNFVLIGKELTEPGDGVLLKLLAFPAFIAAVVTARLLSLALARRQRGSVRALLALQCVCLLGFMAAGLAAAPIGSTNQPLPIAAGVLGAFAMGLQNAQARIELAALVPTTVMTGNVTQVVIDVVDLAIGRAGTGADLAATKARFAKMAPAVAGFGLGAIGGAVSWRVASFWGLAVPAALLAALALRRG